MADSASASARERWIRALERLEEKDLRRSLRVTETPSVGEAAAGDPGEAGPVDLASNDYLGLAGDARLAEAAGEAARRWGVGAGASRLVTGNRPPHASLEEELAAYKHVEAALVFSSGYAANVGLVSALAGPRDAVFADRLSHASLIDGARQSGATFRLYRHGDLDHLEGLLGEAGDRGDRYVLTDGVFSMDGELAPLPELVELCDRWDALLVVDDAHGTGVVGPDGRGTVAHFGLEDRIPVRVATLSKALGTQGGAILGEEPLVELLVNKARSFVYSTGLAPPIAAAAEEAVRIARNGRDRRARLREHLRTLREGLLERGYRVRGEDPAPMIAVEVGEPGLALRLADRLNEAGIRAPAIRPPTVPEGTSRIRLAPRATHRSAEIRRALDAFPPADALD